jgi:photosystem II stability/assembly factor-like uncharacterized protein
LLLSILFIFSIHAQPPATTVAEVQSALRQKAEMQTNSIVKNVPFSNIGPTIMSGRVTDLAVNPDNPAEFYVAYASGGLWHTVNNGTSFTPVLDSSNTQNVGDIAVNWATRTIWVGTGENNSSRSSYAGIGILRSDDNGKTWTHMGLGDSQHIGRILINPDNPDELVVGVTGHLYTPNDERGIYKTTDGGKTWQRKLFVSNSSGIIDLQHAPGNFNTLFASSWDKDRKAWNFRGNGPESAIYKSTDAGETWTRISTAESGFPTGDGVGRIGLAVFDENTVYAIHDSQYRRPEEGKDKNVEALTKDHFKTMGTATFLALDSKDLDDFLKSNGFPEKYRSESVKAMIRSEKATPADIARYLENANSIIFDTPVVGAEVYRSDDGGMTWVKTHDDYLDDLYYSYGYYFGHIYVSPANADHIYIYGVPILKSKDGGKSFSYIGAENVHADHHALWINPKDPNHLIDGNDGGVNISYDDGENWIKNNSPSVGQFYAINVDNANPYNVYGGLQDNGVWVGPHNAQENKAWHQEGQYPWKRLSGGDGMQIEIDSRDHNIVYTGFQFGYYYRVNKATGESKFIQPKHELGDNPYRFNWQTPIHLSPHNQDILYLGGNKLMRSMNQGDDWKAISDDLTTGGKKGNVAYGTLTSISESPFQFGLIYVGSDDGYLHVTSNGGGSWQRISDALPKDLWVSRVIASQHKKERVYVTMNGYRWDDFTAYVYMSEDMGASWKDISGNLPASPVNVIREDSKNEQILYLGNDNGAYVSFNKGASWEAFSKGLTAAAVHDIAVQPEAKDLLVGTHGRSIYRANITALQMMDESLDSKRATLFEMTPVTASGQWGHASSHWLKPYEPSVSIAFYANSGGAQRITIRSEGGAELSTLTIEADKGFNYADYDLSITEAGQKALETENDDLEIKKAMNGKWYLPKGTYIIQINSEQVSLEVK